MLWIKIGIGAMVAVDLLLIAFLMLRRPTPAGRFSFVLSATAFVLLPGLTTVMGGFTHLEQSKSTEFCLSCHVMEPYGTSLLIDQAASLPAHHYQNKLVPRQQACYACHTSYTMYGGLRAKFQGAVHLYVNYLGTIPDPLKLYQPYQNRECLHCHAGARTFEEDFIHSGIRGELETDQTSCLECHDFGHGISELKDYPLWKGNS